MVKKKKGGQSRTAQPQSEDETNEVPHSAEHGWPMTPTQVREPTSFWWFDLREFQSMLQFYWSRYRKFQNCGALDQ